MAREEAGDELRGGWASLLGLRSCKMGAMESVEKRNSHGLTDALCVRSGHSADSRLRGQKWNVGDQLGAEAGLSNNRQ